MAQDELGKAGHRETPRGGWRGQIVRFEADARGRVRQPSQAHRPASSGSPLRACLTHGDRPLPQGAVWPLTRSQTAVSPAGRAPSPSAVSGPLASSTSSYAGSGTGSRRCRLTTHTTRAVAVRRLRRRRPASPAGESSQRSRPVAERGRRAAQRQRRAVELERRARRRPPAPRPSSSPQVGGCGSQGAPVAEAAATGRRASTGSAPGSRRGPARCARSAPRSGRPAPPRAGRRPRAGRAPRPGRGRPSRAAPASAASPPGPGAGRARGRAGCPGRPGRLRRRRRRWSRAARSGSRAG